MLFSLRGGSVRVESPSKGRQEGRAEALSLGNGLKGYVRMFSLRGEDVLVKPLRAKRQRGERKVKARWKRSLSVMLHCFHCVFAGFVVI